MTKHLLLGATLLLAFVVSSPAPSHLPPPPSDIDVTVDGNTYDVSTILTTYSTSSSLLQTQSWWGNIQLANDISTAVAFQLGKQASASVLFSSAWGPAFAFADAQGSVGSMYWQPTTGIQLESDSSIQTFAVATIVPVPESAINPLFIGVAGLVAGWRSWRTVRPVRA